jgi:hypothetical protein
MNNQRTIVYTLSVILVLAVASLAVLYIVRASSAPPSPEIHHLVIMKVQDTWKVVQEEDSTRTLVVARKGDRIRWIARGSDVYFQFMDARIFGGHTQMLPDGKELTLTVSRVARAGENPYAVFCLKDREFARGDSPPVIIIE